MNKTEYIITPIKYAIHPKGESPIYGECSTYIELADEAGGMFVILTQEPSAYGEGGSLRFDFEEFQIIVDKMKQIEQEMNDDTM